VASPRLDRGEAGWGIAQSGIDLGQHTLQIAINFVIPETQYLEPFAGKAIVAPSVTPGMRIEIMLATVDLDDKAMFKTDEIDNTTIERGLTPEVKSSFFAMSVDEPTILFLAGSFACEGCGQFRSP
jgi:hypothetical protein